MDLPGQHGPQVKVVWNGTGNHTWLGGMNQHFNMVLTAWCDCSEGEIQLVPGGHGAPTVRG